MSGRIRQANNLSWGNPTRVAFLIADCPCHGTEFHSLTDDSYPKGTPGINIVEELRNILKYHTSNGTMSVHFGSITNFTDDMIERFRTGYGIDLTVGSVDDKTKLKTVVTSSFRRSIFKTMSLAGSHKGAKSFAPVGDINSLMETANAGGASGRAPLMWFRLVSNMPSTNECEWSRCPSLKVSVYRNLKIKSLKDLRAPIGFGLIQVKNLVLGSTPHEATLVARQSATRCMYVVRTTLSLRERSVLHSMAS